MGRMCGLLTFVSNFGVADAFRDRVADAVETLHHRGPDETGIEVIGDFAVLAHKRLSIIDVTGSQEPLPYAGGRYCLVLNGEIYNYIELRAELTKEFGAEFATLGDGEVLVAGFHYWGEAVLDRLRGMFAFIIVDTEERLVFGARDPFGIKPLFHMRTDDGVFLASEKKAFLPFVTPAVDLEGLHHYLSMQYVPEPGTLMHGVGRIGPGECFSHRPGGELEIRRYYHARFRPVRSLPPEALYARIQDVLRDSVRMHLRSDVPVGAFMSSGIDSTAVVALAREVNPDILTFTVAHDGQHSELGVAEETARELGVTLIPAEITPQVVQEVMPAVVWHLDDPIGDTSLVALYLVAQKAAEHVRVVLAGEGADELFAGYRTYHRPGWLKMTPVPCDPIRRALGHMAGVIPEALTGEGLLMAAAPPLTDRYGSISHVFSEAEKRLLLRDFSSAYSPADVSAQAFVEATMLGMDEVATMQHIDLATWLCGEILVKADRMSMAHSLELRVPFLDRAVFDVAATISAELKVPAGPIDVTKFALRQALRGVVPPAIVNRPKLPFPVPVLQWLRGGDLYHWALEVLASSAAGHLIDLGYVAGLLAEGRRKQNGSMSKVWTVVVFCLWHALFVERSITVASERRAGTILPTIAVRERLAT
jgi:asparagine synthase (glutamine-hydrolysing)